MTAEQLNYISNLESRGGKLAPEDVLAAAKSDSSPIHGCFEWDDATAGTAYRIEQARELIRRVHIELTYKKRDIRVVRYVRDPSKTMETAGYVHILRPKGNAARRVYEREWEAVIALADRAHRITIAKSDELEDGYDLVAQAEHVLVQLRAMID